MEDSQLWSVSTDFRPWEPVPGACVTDFLATCGFEVTYEAYQWRKGGTLRRVFASDLAPGEEVSFRNRVDRDGEVRYVPVVDFVSPQLGDDTLTRLAGALLPFRAPMHLFETGRSFHGYVPSLVTPERWVHFLGAMLLLNPVKGALVTDGRWIGHKLKQGYASLRLTAHTARHAYAPRFVRTVYPRAGVSLPEDDYE